MPIQVVKCFHRQPANRISLCEQGWTLRVQCGRQGARSHHGILYYVFKVLNGFFFSICAKENLFSPTLALTSRWWWPQVHIHKKPSVNSGRVGAWTKFSTVTPESSVFIMTTKLLIKVWKNNARVATTGCFFYFIWHVENKWDTISINKLLTFPNEQNPNELTTKIKLRLKGKVWPWISAKLFSLIFHEKSLFCSKVNTESDLQTNSRALCVSWALTKLLLKEICRGLCSLGDGILSLSVF